MWRRQSWFSLNGTIGIQGQGRAKGTHSYATQLLNTNQRIRAPRSLGLMRVGCRERLELSLNGAGRDTEQLGGAVHRQATDIEQHGGGFQGQWLAAGGVSVKFRPQPLHKYRCWPRISPFL